MDYRELIKQNSIIGNLTSNKRFRHPTPDDIGKPVYYENGSWVGQLHSLENDQYGVPRVTVTRNDNIYEFTYPVEHMYVEINPRVGGKSRRRRTKKTRRGKSKRRGRKTRGQRR